MPRRGRLGGRRARRRQAWCARVDGACVGVLAAVPDVDSPAFDRALKGVLFAVHPAHRRRGVAAGLVGTCWRALRGGRYRRYVATGVSGHSAGMLRMLERLGGRPEHVHVVFRKLAWIRTHGPTIAAVLVEPVQTRRPDLQPVAFLRELRAITEGCGAALVFDEVVTGFRAHPAGCQGLWGIRADLAVFGKALGAGMPVGVVAGRRRWMAPIEGVGAPRVFTAGTFNHHPVLLHAARAFLREIVARGGALHEEMTLRTERLASALEDVFARRHLDASRFVTAGSQVAERHLALRARGATDDGLVLDGAPALAFRLHEATEARALATLRA